MGYYARKTITGFKETEFAKEIQNELYYILPALEYQEMQEREDELRRHYWQVVEESQKKVQSEGKKNDVKMEEFRIQCEKNVAEKVRQIEVDRDKAINLAKTKEKLYIQQCELNKNLIRIARERANVQRGITPKKSHSGYLVLHSDQLRYKYRTKQSFDAWRKENPHCDSRKFREYEQRETLVWKSVIQTPFSTMLDFDSIEMQIWEELWKRVFLDVGITAAQKERGVYLAYEGNLLFDWFYKRDFRSGYWEIELYHLEPLKVSKEYYIAKERRNDSERD